MPNIGDFVRDWNFTPDFDSDSFPQGHTLLIGAADEGKYDVSWLDSESRHWRITNLPLVGDTLTQEDPIAVSSGQISKLRYVTLQLINNTLNGSLETPSSPRGSSGEEPVGGFTAEADHPAKEDLDATRQEESLAV